MKDLSLITNKERKKWLVITIGFGVICIITAVVEYINNKTCYSASGVIAEIISAFIIPKIKGKYHRGEQILKIFEECNEEEKKDIYEFVKKYDKEETH